METEDLVLWDVVEEHLAEAGFLWTLWGASLDDHDYTLREVAAGPEARMLAHLDGLVVAGPIANRALFDRAVEEFDPELSETLVAASAALCLLGDFAPLQAALLADEMPGRAAIVDGCSLFLDAELAKWLTAALQDERPQVVAGLLQLAYAHELKADLKGAWRHEDPGVLRAALRLGRFGGGDSSRAESLVEHGDPGVSEEAVIAGLHRGSLPAWRRCLKLGFERPLLHPRLTLLAGALGSDREVHALTSLAADEAHAAVAIRALGLAGSLAGMETILSALDHADPRVAKCAGEAFSTITGREITADELSLAEEPTEPDDAATEEDLAPTGEDGLLLPDAAAIRGWWAENAPTNARNARALGGQPKEPARLLTYLEHAPTRRRHALALALSVKTAGLAHLNTRTLSARQFQAIERAGDRLRVVNEFGG